MNDKHTCTLGYKRDIEISEKLVSMYDIHKIFECFFNVYSENILIHIVVKNRKDITPEIFDIVFSKEGNNTLKKYIAYYIEADINTCFYQNPSIYMYNRLSIDVYICMIKRGLDIYKYCDGFDFLDYVLDFCDDDTILYIYSMIHSLDNDRVIKLLQNCVYLEKSKDVVCMVIEKSVDIMDICEYYKFIIS